MGMMTQQTDEQLAAKAMEEGKSADAVRLLRPLAERESQYGLICLGWIYETGAQGAQDKAAAAIYYERAAALGSADACLNLGWLMLEQGQETQARSVFERGAALGKKECATALTKLAVLADEQLAGEAVENWAYDEAVRRLRPLVALDSEYALRTLGWILETGAIGTPDKAGARALYERAASNGSAAACYDLGQLLLELKQENRARETYQEGARRGDLACMAEFGRMLVEGKGGPADPIAGRTWLESAAASGHFFAQRTLLAMDESNAGSALERLLIRGRIVALAVKAARVMGKNPRSEKLR